MALIGCKYEYAQLASVDLTNLFTASEGTSINRQTVGSLDSATAAFGGQSEAK